MELIAQTAAAVAVDDDLTTLIDWTNIELFAGATFTLIVTNVGGGSADDLTDVTIDTSVDGGTTVLTDQHAGVPAVPIADGNSPSGTFTETAAFVRVRAVCTTDEDTTATALLLASTVSPRLCTLADVKERLGLTVTDHDILLARIVLGIVSVFEGHCEHPLIQTAADVTEYLSGRGTHLQLSRYPVISITSIKESWDWDFDSADALTANTDYRLVNDGVKGILYRCYTTWPRDIPDSVQAVYRGGYCPAGSAPGTGEISLPADLREAAIEQATLLFKRRDDIGLSGVGFDGGSISKFSKLELLPLVKEVLEKYRRHTL